MASHMVDRHNVLQADASDSSSPEATLGLSKRDAERKSEREKRTYRACLHCRQRKSRCDLYVGLYP